MHRQLLFATFKRIVQAQQAKPPSPGQNVRLRWHIRSRMASTLPKLPVFQAIQQHDPNSLAVIHSSSGREFSYGSLLHDVAATKDHIAKVSNAKPLSGERIAFLAENGYDYIGTVRAHFYPSCG